MPEQHSSVLRLYRRLAALPAGRWLFSQAVCFQAPYFGTISPRFVELGPGHCEVRMRKRRGVQNHLGTVHAIAMANLCELAAGTMTEVSVPPGMRWIPKGMTIEYLRKATTGLRAVCRLEQLPTAGVAADLPVTVNVLDEANEAVVRAVITMWVSPRRSVEAVA